MATLFNGSLSIQGIFDATNTLGKADTTSDTIFSVLNNVSYSSNQRVMMEIGASNTNVGNYNSFYKYSLGYSNTANGPGGSFVIQGCPVSTNTYNNVNPPITLMTLDRNGASFKFYNNYTAPAREEEIFNLYSDNFTTAVTSRAGQRGTFTQYYNKNTGGGLTQDSYELWWYPTAGQGGLGGNNLYNQVWNLNPVANYWNINIINTTIY